MYTPVHNKFYLMRRCLMAIVVAVATILTAGATGQITERINDNGVIKKLCTCIIEDDTMTFDRVKELLPAQTNTALWRKYVGSWRITNDSLFLDSLTTVADKAIDINKIYTDHTTPSGIFADWFSGTLRIVSGEIVRYIHMGWESIWEQEEFVTVDHGKVTGRRTATNRVILPGRSAQDIRAVLDSFDLGAFPELKRVIALVEYNRFDSDGLPIDCNIELRDSINSTDEGKHLKARLKQFCIDRQLFPFYDINGKIQSIPYTLILRRKEH